MQQYEYSIRGNGDTNSSTKIGANVMVIRLSYTITVGGIRGSGGTWYAFVDGISCAVRTVGTHL